MHRALIRKELFQCGALCVIAMLAYVAFVGWYSTRGMHQNAVPFFGGAIVPLFGRVPGIDPVVGNFSLIGGLLAIVMGLMQSAWEFVGGTWHFLLYRPISRRQVLKIKVLTGLSLLMNCTMLPGLLYAVWADSTGTHASPFAWWMTEKFWQQWLTLPVLYLASFQSGLFDARWYGVRLLPVLTAGVLCVVFSLWPFWWLTAFPILVALLVLQSVTLLHTMQTRDFS